MTDRLEQFHEDRALRDAARANLLSDLDHAKQSLSGKGIASRFAGRIGDGALDVFEVAKEQADDKRGVIAILVGAIVLWLSRNPILELLGLVETDAEETRDDALDGQPQETGAEEALRENEPEGGDDNERTDN